MSTAFLFYTPYATAKGHALPFVLRTSAHFLEHGRYRPVIFTGEGFLEQAGEFPCETVEVDGARGSSIDAERFQRFGAFSAAVRGLKRWWIDRRVARRFSSFMPERRDVRIVFFENYEYMTLYRCWRHLRRRRPDVAIVVVSHLASFDGLGVSRAARWYKGAVRGVFRRVLSDADGVVYTGETVREKVQAQLKLPAEAVRRGHVMQWPTEEEDARIDRAEARARLGIPADANVALLFGTLRKDKGIDVAIEAVARAATAPWLLVVGPSASVSEEQIRSWVATAGIEDRVVLRFGYVTSDEEQYYSAADVFLYPCDPRLSNHQSGVLSTCRTYRLPAIVSDSGEIGDYVRRYAVGWTARGGDSSAFAAALDDYFRDPRGARSAIEPQIAEAARRFTWRNAVTVLEGAFEDGLRRRQATHPR